MTEYDAGYKVGYDAGQSSRDAETERLNATIGILVGGLSGCLIVVNHMVDTAGKPDTKLAMENWRDRILTTLSESNAARQQRERTETK